MNGGTLNSALQTAITSYATTINVWSQSTYSRNHTFFDRLDIKNLPQSTDCPCCVLRPRSRVTGQNVKNPMYHFILWAWVSDSSSSGFTNGEAYRTLLETALVNKINSLNNSLSMVDLLTKYDDIEHYPLLLIEMEFAVKQELSMNAGTRLT